MATKGTKIVRLPVEGQMCAHRRLGHGNRSPVSCVLCGETDRETRPPGFASCANPGFSLVEVILAVGIFAAAVTVMLALLPALTRQAAGSADTLTVLRLTDAIRTEFQRLATSGGFDNLAGRTGPMATTPPATLTLVASRDVTRVHSLSYLPPVAAEQIAQDEQFFLVETWRFSSPPLAFDPNGAVLALHIRVSWPYYTPGSTAPVPPADREQATFNLALDR